MPTVDFPAPPPGVSRTPSGVSGQQGNFSPNNRADPEGQAPFSSAQPSMYQRRKSYYKGDSQILLGQTDFAATLGRPCVVHGTADGRAQRGSSTISQVFVPLPSSFEDVSPVEVAADGDAGGVSKERVRLLYIIFLAQKFCCELLGTLFLVTSIALAEKGSHAQFAPFSVSAVVYVLTFLFVPISGAHFNPAVSTAMFLTSKHFRYFEYFAYFLCQLFGGTCGALIGTAIMGTPLEVLPLDPGASSARSIFHEVIPTILLIYTALVLSYATNAGDVSLLTVPFTASMAVLFGAIAGATMNPAVATGIYMSHLMVGSERGMTRELMTGIFCPFLGALLSVLGFVITHAYTNPIEIRFIHFL